MKIYFIDFFIDIILSKEFFFNSLKPLYYQFLKQLKSNQLTISQA